MCSHSLPDKPVSDEGERLTPKQLKFYLEEDVTYALVLNWEMTNVQCTWKMYFSTWIFLCTGFEWIFTEDITSHHNNKSGKSHSDSITLLLSCGWRCWELTRLMWWIIFREPEWSPGEAEAGLYRQHHWQHGELSGLPAQGTRQQQWVQSIDFHLVCSRNTHLFVFKKHLPTLIQNQHEYIFRMTQIWIEQSLDEIWIVLHCVRHCLPDNWAVSHSFPASCAFAVACLADIADISWYQ